MIYRSLIPVVFIVGGLIATAVPSRADALFFVLDISGSMLAPDADAFGTTRHAAMKSAVDSMIRASPPDIQIGFLIYENTVRIEQTLTLDRAVILTKLAALDTSTGATATGDALNAARPEIQNALGKKIIVLVTDGLPVPASQEAVAITAATNAGSANVQICVIGFGAAVGVPGPNAQFLTNIATASGGTAILAPDAAALATALDTCLSLFRQFHAEKYVAAVMSYPNPAVGSSARITFAPTGNPLADTTISPISNVTIYDLSGRRIIQLQGTGSSTLVWDTRNHAGLPIGSGMYYYVVQFSSGITGRGKFTIVR